MHVSVVGVAQLRDRYVSPVPMSMTSGNSKSPGNAQLNAINKNSSRGASGFDGLNLVESETGTNKAESNISNLEIRKAERRRKSLDMMRKSAQSEQIREIYSNTIVKVPDYSPLVTGTAEERFQLIMTRAKENGMTAESIFNVFSGGNPNTWVISAKKFLDSLEKLGETFVFTETELDGLVRKIDKNRDGNISLAELKHYCYYEIQSIPWKAERARLEESGELQKIKAQVSRKFSGEIRDVIGYGHEVFRSSKFFWRTNANVEIRMFHCELLNVITIQLFNQTTGKDLPPIFVCKNKVDIQNPDLSDELHKLAQMRNSIYSKDEQLSIATRDMWESIGKYLIARLNIKDQSLSEGTEVIHYLHFFLKKGDTFDTLMVQKPLNLETPSSMFGASTIDDFNVAVASFARESRSARFSRLSAEDLSSLVSSVLSEVQGVGPS